MRDQYSNHQMEVGAALARADKPEIPEVQRMIQRLDLQLSQIQKTANNLYQRLELAMRREPPPQSNDAVSRAPVTMLGDQLQGLNISAQETLALLENMLQRLEL